MKYILLICLIGGLSATSAQSAHFPTLSQLSHCGSIMGKKNFLAERSTAKLSLGTEAAYQFVPAKPDRPTYLPMTGWLSTMGDYDALTSALLARGDGVFRMDSTANHETLRLNLMRQALFQRPDFSSEMIAREYAETLRIAKVSRHAIPIVLSYSSTWVRELEKFWPLRNDVVFLAPMTNAGDHGLPNYDMLMRNLDFTRRWFGHFAYEAAYTQMLNAFLDPLLMLRMPTEIPLDVPYALFRSGLVELSRAAREFDIQSLSGWNKTIHMIVAGHEKEVRRKNQDAFFERYPHKGHYFLIPESIHTIHQANPAEVAAALAIIETRRGQPPQRFVWDAEAKTYKTLAPEN